MYKYIGYIITFIIIVIAVYFRISNSSEREKELAKYKQDHLNTRNQCKAVSREIQFFAKIVRINQSEGGDRGSALITLEPVEEKPDTTLSNSKCPYLFIKDSQLFLRTCNQSLDKTGERIYSDYYLKKDKGSDSIQVLDENQNKIYSFPIFEGFDNYF